MENVRTWLSVLYKDRQLKHGYPKPFPKPHRFTWLCSAELGLNTVLPQAGGRSCPPWSSLVLPCGRSRSVALTAELGALPHPRRGFAWRLKKRSCMDPSNSRASSFLHRAHSLGVGAGAAGGWGGGTGDPGLGASPPPPQNRQPSVPQMQSLPHKLFIGSIDYSC